MTTVKTLPTTDWETVEPIERTPEETRSMLEAFVQDRYKKTLQGFVTAVKERKIPDDNFDVQWALTWIEALEEHAAAGSHPDDVKNLVDAVFANAPGSVDSFCNLIRLLLSMTVIKSKVAGVLRQNLI